MRDGVAHERRDEELREAIERLGERVRRDLYDVSGALRVRVRVAETAAVLRKEHVEAVFGRVLGTTQEHLQTKRVHIYK